MFQLRRSHARRGDQSFDQRASFEEALAKSKATITRGEFLKKVKRSGGISQRLTSTRQRWAEMKYRKKKQPELLQLSDLNDALASMEGEHMDLLRKALPADSAPADPTRHLVVAALRRSLDNIKGFRAMADQRNIYCGMPIVRFQIDTAMFLFARTIVKDVTDFMSHVAEGKQVSDYEYFPNKKLSDSFLHQQLTKKYPLMSDLYKEASGFVHFSWEHIHRVLDLTRFEQTQESTFKKLDDVTAGWDEEELRGAVTCFLWATNAILDECHDWDAKRALAT
jgi:hypothetical protein